MIRIQVINRIHSAARATLILLLVLPFLGSLRPALAADLSSRQIQLSSPTVSTNVRHTFSFYNPTAATIGSMVFEYCESPLVSDPCIASPGLDVSAATLTTQTGNVGFTIHPNTTANRLVIGRIPAGSLPTNNSYEFTDVRNPDTPDRSYYVRISIHASDDGTGVDIDRGSVAYATSGSFNIGAYVPPFLIFCVGVTVSLNCDSTTGNLISFGVLSPSVSSLATTQFAGATNDSTGYQVFLNGQTMTSGNNVIPPLLVPTSSTLGTSQFGLNMRFNNSPVVGSEPSGTGSATVHPKYSSANAFAFGDGDITVSATLPTEFNRFTQSYLVNVSSAQSAGVYSTTLIYTAVASF